MLDEGDGIYGLVGCTVLSRVLQVLQVLKTVTLHHRSL